MQFTRISHANTINMALAAIAINLPLQLHAAIIINEIDYDQPGGDTAEFIELYNNSSNAVSLDAFTIELVNGDGGVGAVYRTIDLAGFSMAANGYFVICNDTSQVANCNYNFTTSAGWFQNGPTDALALLENAVIVDSLAYEGELVPYTEGTALLLADSNTEIMSISRLPNGTDFDDNGLDFSAGCLTPGGANIAGKGNCSTPAVPLPAAVWLFGSGLVGLMGVARHRNRQ